MNREHAQDPVTRSATETTIQRNPQPGKRALTETMAPIQRLPRGDAAPGAPIKPSRAEPTGWTGRAADSTRPMLEALFGGHLHRPQSPGPSADAAHSPEEAIQASSDRLAAGSAVGCAPTFSTDAGTPLPDPVREKMEAAFGVGFSQVRVHEGSQAASLGAIAYTQGNDIHFSPGSYEPTSRRGQELLGHELTHVVQQGAGRVSVPQGKDAPINTDPILETEADELGARAAGGEPVQVPGAGGPPTAGGPIQGVFLDQALEPPRDDGGLRERDDHAKGRAVNGALDQVKTFGHPKRAWWSKKLIKLVQEYEAADKARDAARAKQSLVALSAFADQVGGKTSDARLQDIAAQLAQEAKQIVEDLTYAEQALEQLASMKAQLDKSGKGNADKISKLRNEADGRRIKYGTGREQFGVCTLIQLTNACNEGDTLLDQWAAVKSEKHGQDKEETKLYGKPRQGKIPSEIRIYLEEFKRISAFLEDKNRVIENLRPIAKRVKAVQDDKKLEALKQALADVEQHGGFPTAVLIPMGILPAEVFLKFNAEAVMDDYGAGVVHGELSHRLQWAAIIGYVDENRSDFTHTPWQLYTQMSSPPFSGGRFSPGSSTWGAIVDANTLQHARDYHAPATLNRDLLDSVPEEHDAHHAHSTNFPLPERPEDYAPPDDLAKLAPIGIALSLLREERVRQELEATGEDALPKNSLDVLANGGMGVRQWSGVPSEVTSTQTTKEMLESGKFEIVNQGSNGERSAFDPRNQEAPQKPWMILKEKTPTDDSATDSDHSADSRSSDS